MTVRTIHSAWIWRAAPDWAWRIAVDWAWRTAPGVVLALALCMPAGAQIVAGTDTLFTARSLEGEFFRSPDNQVTLGLRTDPDGALAITTMTVTVKTPQGEQEFPVEAVEQVVYDPVARTFRATFRRNEARARALEGVLAADVREFHQVRTFSGTLTFESGRAIPVSMTGTQNNLLGKPNCFFDLFSGASLAAVTLKRPYDSGKPDWLQPIALQNGWTVLRRRIDYVRGEEEYDVQTGAGRELAALNIIRTLPDVGCISFGADEGGAVESMRIVSIPRGTLMQGNRFLPADALKSKIAAVFAGAAQFDVMLADGETGYGLTVRAPGRFFGMTQFANDIFAVTVRLQPGLAPVGSGDIREMARISVQAVARSIEKKDQPVDLKSLGPGTADVILQEWLPRIADGLAGALGGSLN